MQKLTSHSWSRLDQIALDIEFLVISIIQGVALAALAGAAIGPITTLSWQYLPYVVSGFLLILVFWSGAIIHAVSFIDWPLDLTHSFLYFLASFLEVMAFSRVEDPIWWFVFLLLFQIVAGILYLYDLSLIKKHQKKFSTTSAKQQLFSDMLKQQKRELRLFVPGSIIFSIIALTTLVGFPTMFFGTYNHFFFIFGQLILLVMYLVNASINFMRRSALLERAL